MPTVEENRHNWTIYSWIKQGDEWSSFWGGTESLWWGTLLPRIHAFVPTDTILEIAPGYGRITHYLKDLCKELIVVDVTEACIGACKQRFSASCNITYHVNDGKSLAMVPDQSVDFVFSFDSLVHVEGDVIEAYLSQMSRILKPESVGFIHHSNLDAMSPAIKALPPVKKRLRNIWRGETMGARLFQAYCEQAGLQCIAQEIMNRTTKYPLPHDCFSLFTLKDSVWARPNRVFKNLLFSYEALYLKRLSQLYPIPSF